MTKKVPANIRKLMKELKQGLSNIYGVKLKVDIAAGRAYYALFYIAEASLNEKGLKFSMHGAAYRVGDLQLHPKLSHRS